MRLVLASNNAKKLAELRELFAGLRVVLVPQGELGIAEAEEPHGTFIENALAKARHAARAGGGAALADDSGLCVPALGGAPGVQSAVYAGSQPAAAGAGREARRQAQDAANNRLLLQRLAGLAADDAVGARSAPGASVAGEAGGAGAVGGPAPGGREDGAAKADGRRAYFACTLVALRHADDPEPLVATGRWWGTVLAAPRGDGGFGYDPLLFIPALGASVAELAPQVKNGVSHRAQAARQLRELLASVWGL
ncbi:MAG: non-canonical purine NTP pyrophosphatase [Rubrivivax sp.]|nr:non-canonical purine NTP pyrophosphatase [Rubrivivax sp.]